MKPPAPFPVALRALGLLWLFCALAVGKLQLLQCLPALAIPGIVLALTGGLLLAYQYASSVRAWLDALDLRTLGLLHVIRFFGFYFLYLEVRGFLPPDFYAAGIGEILVAFLALVVGLAPLPSSQRRRAVTIWNVLGLVGILVVMFNATRLGLVQPWSLRPFAALPLSLLPTLLMPLLLATHVIIFLRLLREADSQGSPGRGSGSG
jgi:hypothetical protein